MIPIFQTLRQGFKCKQFLWEVIPGSPSREWEKRVRQGTVAETMHINEQVTSVGNQGLTCWESLGLCSSLLIVVPLRCEEAGMFIHQLFPSWFEGCL